MTIETPLHAAHQLDQLAGQFEAWRQRRAHPHERIPDALWAQAVALTTTLPPARVAKQLRLRGHDLKKQIRQRQGAPEMGPAPRGFVEVPPLPARLPVPDSLDIELQRPDGTRLRLLVPAVSLSLAPLVQSFVEARPCSN